MKSGAPLILERGLEHYEKTGQLFEASTTEQLMVAFAIKRWDLVSHIEDRFVDPLHAWYFRLNGAQRAAVLTHRSELAECIAAVGREPGHG